MEKWPCEKCGVPIVSTFTYCPSCGQPQTGSAAPTTLVNRDVEHLKLLGIFYYIMAAFSALMGTVPVIHLVIGILIASGSADFGPSSPNEPDARIIGFIFIGMAALFILGGWTSAVLQFLAARNLRAHRRKGFCTFVAALSCINVPVGTVLGVITLIVLARPTVPPLFDAEADRSRAG